MNRADIRLYALLDPEHSGGRPLEEMAIAAVSGGATLLQLRDKISETRTMLESARAIQAAIKGTGVPLIINDRVDVALACDADGVHLGQSDMPVPDARRLLGPDRIIGLSIKTDADARNAPVELLDYAFVGGVYPTSSKDNPDAIGIDGWIRHAATLRARMPGLPVGAIAGITPEKVKPLFEAGCDGIAVISAIFESDDVAAATRTFAAEIEQVQTDGSSL